MKVWDEVSKERPVSVVRRGVAGSGFEFKFVLCKDKIELRKYASSIPYAKREPWFGDAVCDCDDPNCECTGIPVAYTSVVGNTVLNGMFEEAVGTFMVSANIMLVNLPGEQDAMRRHLMHEVGHAVAFCAAWYPEVVMRGLRRDMSDADVARMNLGKTEFYGYGTEMLVEIADRLLTKDPSPVASGFYLLFPWLGGVL